MKQRYFSDKLNRLTYLLLSSVTAVCLFCLLVNIAYAQDSQPTIVPIISEGITAGTITNELGLPMLRLRVPFRLQTGYDGYLYSQPAPVVSLQYTPTGGFGQNPLVQVQVDPMTVLLLLDNSGSMEAALPNAVAVASAIVETAPEATRFALLTLNERLSYEQPPHQNKTEIANSLANVQMTDEASCLYDGLAAAVDTLIQLEPNPTRRAILFLSDGFDELSRWQQRPCSANTLDTAIMHAEAAGVPIYGYPFFGLRREEAAPAFNSKLFLKLHRTGGLMLDSRADAFESGKFWEQIGMQWIASADFYTDIGAQTAFLHMNGESVAVPFSAQLSTLFHEEVTAVCDPYQPLTQQINVRNIQVDTPQQISGTVVSVVSDSQTVLSKTVALTETAVALKLPPSTLLPQKRYQVQIVPYTVSSAAVPQVLPPNHTLSNTCLEFIYQVLPTPAMTVGNVLERNGKWIVPIIFAAPAYFSDTQASLIYDPFWGRPQLFPLDLVTASGTLPADELIKSVTFSWQPPVGHAGLFTAVNRVFNRHTLIIEGIGQDRTRLAMAKIQPATLFSRDFFSGAWTVLRILFWLSLLVLCGALLVMVLEINRVRSVEETAVPLAKTTATNNPVMHLYVKETADRAIDQRQFGIQGQKASHRFWSVGRLQCDLNLPGDGRLAEKHAQIRYDEIAEQFQIMDLGSQNKSWVDNRLLAPHRWEPLAFRPHQPIMINVGGKTILEVSLSPENNSSG